MLYFLGFRRHTQPTPVGLEDHGPPLPIRPGMMTERRSPDPPRRASADMYDNHAGAAHTMAGYRLPLPATLGPSKPRVRMLKFYGEVSSFVQSCQMLLTFED